MRHMWICSLFVFFTAGLTMAETVEVVVDGRLLKVNDQTTVPRGLFGVHAFGLTLENVAEYGIDSYRQIHFSTGSGSGALSKDGKVKPVVQELEMYIDCMGDRYHPPIILSNKNYKEFFEKIGREYGERMKAVPDYQAYVEFWNEPYLNWASRSHGSGRNVYHPKWYKLDEATDGGKVTLKWDDKPLEHLRWRKLWAKGEDGKIYYGVDVPNDAKAGDTFRGSSPSGWYFTNREEQTFTVVEQWGIHDPTQVGFWSGRQNLDFYLRMFEPWADAMHEANPNVKILAGWDFGFSHGHWSVFRELIAPTIDATIDHIDGVTEHHYGSQTREVTAWYEVACAYSVPKHGKAIRGYNTECGGKLDPAVHGTIEVDDNKARDLSATATYHLRDILELCYRSPDKSGSRTAHHPDQATLEVLKFLKPLQGELMNASVKLHSDRDQQLWPVVSWDQRQNLVVVVFNNATQPQEVTFKVKAPDGYAFGKQGATLAYLHVTDQPRVEPVVKPIDFDDGNTVTVNHTIGARQAVRLVLPTKSATQEVVAQKRVERNQFYANELVLHDVKADKPVTLSIDIPQEKLKDADAAQLRLVLDGQVQLRYTINNASPQEVTGEWVTDLKLDLKQLKPGKNTLVFYAKPDQAYLLCAASILIQH